MPVGKQYLSVRKMEIITKDQIRTTKWSGGTTSQLYIYPEQASYAERDFLFRISSARVEVAESTFTALPGVNREIMILDGTLDLEHHGKYKKTLKTFHQDSFPGHWHTTSRGKVTDFNLMTKAPNTGSLTHFSCKRDELVPKIDVVGTIFIALYLFTGSMAITTNNEAHKLNVGEMVCFHDVIEYAETEMIALSASEVVVVAVE